MQHSNSGQKKLFHQLLSQNDNPPGYKDVLSQIAKGIEQRTYWYYTTDEADFLTKIYDRQLDQEVLKKRIGQITEERMTELMSEIVGGSVKKVNEEEDEGGRLQVQLSVQDFYDEVPQEDQRLRKGRERVKQINEDFHRFKEKMQEKKRSIDMRKSEKYALEAEVKKSLEKQKREEHRKQIKEHIEHIKKSHSQRKEQNQKFKSFFKEYKKAKPLHVLMEQSYKQKVVLPSLEESRRKLQSLGHRKKPTLEEINEHDRFYIQAKTNRPQKLVMLNNTIDISYKSPFYVEEEERMREIKEFEETGPSWDFLEKQKRYSQFVKDKVKPKISRKIKEALQESSDRGHKSMEVPDRHKVIEVGMSYLEYMRGLDKRRTATPGPPVELVKQSRYLDYLQELKSKSEHHTSSMNWQKDMRDMSSSRLERRQRVLMKSKQLQEKAMRDEKLVSHYNYGKAEQIISKKKQIDQTLLSSIKAKVAVLKDAHAS